jgi:hypothetical protein
VILPEEIRPREGRAWLVGWQGTLGLLRRMPVPVALAADLAKETDPTKPLRQGVQIRTSTAKSGSTWGIDDALIQPYSGHATRQSLEIYSRLALAYAQQRYDDVIGNLPVRPTRSRSFALVTRWFLTVNPRTWGRPSAGSASARPRRRPR